jgi:hypothetical protein
VLKSRNSSAWTTTAYRAPRCSWPRARRGGGSRNTSPLTTVSRQVVVERVLPAARESVASLRDRARRQRARVPLLARLNASDDVPPPRAARSARPPSPTSCRHGRCPAPLRRSHRAGHAMSEAPRQCSTNHATARRAWRTSPSGIADATTWRQLAERLPDVNVSDGVSPMLPTGGLRISASGLAPYESCPLQYFYGNLISEPVGGCG